MAKVKKRFKRKPAKVPPRSKEGDPVEKWFFAPTHPSERDMLLDGLVTLANELQLRPSEKEKILEVCERLRRS